MLLNNFLDMGDLLTIGLTNVIYKMHITYYKEELK